MIRRELVIAISLKIPPHLKCVDTLPCEMSSVCRSVSLIAPLVIGVAGLIECVVQQQDGHIEHLIYFKNCRM